MRPRYVINKGIQKRWTAKSSIFEEGKEYVAALYNPKDRTIAIEAVGTCEPGIEGDDKNKITFVFTPAQTELLKEGYATIEIYDEDNEVMAYRDQIAVIRKNSKQIINTVPSEDSESES